jgi:hypothetical protein
MPVKSTYHDDNSASSVYPFDWNQSAVASLPARTDNTRITWFRERRGRFVIVQIIPMLMKGDSIIEESRLDYNMANYVSWYRFIVLVPTRQSGNPVPCKFLHFKLLMLDKFCVN